MPEQPFLRPDAVGWGAIFADGTFHVLAAHGLDRWSVGAIARWMKVQPPAILQRFSRARILELVTAEFATRWTQWATSPGYLSGLPARLPETEHERHGVRVWQALIELARSEQLAGRDAPQQIIVAAHAEETYRLERELRDLCGRIPTTDELIVTAALVQGLRCLLATPGVTTAPAEARRLLREHVARLKEASGP